MGRTRPNFRRVHIALRAAHPRHPRNPRLKTFAQIQKNAGLVVQNHGFKISFSLSAPMLFFGPWQKNTQRFA